VHHALGRNYQQIAYVRAACPASPAGGPTPSITGWRRSTPGPSSFPGWWLAGPIAAPEPGDVAVPHGRPIPIWGYWDDPAMSRDVSTPLEGRYTDNDSWSTNELDVDWQGVTLYNLILARWWAAGAPATPAALPFVPDSPSKGDP
jgi:hypothetical protein